MRPLVIVRPEPGASASAAQARALGIEPIVSPIFEIEPAEWTAPDPADFDGVLLTSANAIRCGGEDLQALRSLAAYCVGEATAKAARDAGFAVAATGEGGVDALLRSIPGELRLAHLCGADRRAPKETAQRIVAITVYRSKELEIPQLGGVDGAVVALHSPRAASVFARRAAEAGLRRGTIAIVAISAAAAKEAGEGWETVESAAQPTDAALLSLAAQLCDKP